uniref:Serpin family A member 11 n=1 Tax=Marmota marmota marmota TaxID=9994 RepID=A0A8C5YP04_MARMA
MGPARLWLLGAGILASVHCQPFPAHGDKSPGAHQPPSHQLSEPAPAYHKVTPTITSFALRLYKRLAAGTPGNILFSPVSLSSTLALLSLGAQGDTSTQILEGLGFNLTETPAADVHRGFQSLLRTLDLPSPKLELKVGSSLFLDKRLKPLQHFLDSTKELYGAFAFSANFSDPATTWRQISEYVRKQTYGHVTDGLPQFSHDTLMVLLNYIFFKGKWKKPFEVDHTKEEDFHVDQATTVRVPMMNRLGMFDLHYCSTLASWVLQMDYLGNATAIFLLPDEGKLQHLEDTITKEILAKFLKNRESSSVNLYFPKLNISGTIDLKPVLTSLGITNVFSEKADLSGITEDAPLRVSQALHKAVLTIDERGTEAAGATVMGIMPVSLLPEVKFDRPFLLVIYEHSTKSPLFVGKVVNPTLH